MIGGAAGDGTFLSGNILARTLMREGLHVFATNEYLSVIRGGYQWYLIRASEREVYSQISRVDLLVALNRDAIKRHKSLLRKDGIMIIDPKDFNNISPSPDIRLVKVPLTDFVHEVRGKRVMRNSAALGATMAVLGYNLETLLSVIRDVFKGREEDLKVNLLLAEKGYSHVKGDSKINSIKLKKSNKIFITGNDAISLGALKAGLGLYVAYPMTPASPILHFLARVQREYEILVFQPESEIAAINIAIGAAYAGVKSMVGTSGGGFSLMTEALGLAAMSETPIVIVVAQRPGPSTGMPTFTSQGDLRFVLHASQGEFPRVVLAPGDVEEAFYLTIKAFNIAWKYQVPVILLTDKYLAESGKSTVLDENLISIEEGKIIRGTYRDVIPYRRYRLTEDGVSPMALPGTKGAIVKANSSEHDEGGFVTTDPNRVVQMVDKRFRKLRELEREMKRSNPVGIYGDEESIILISWGSTKGPILEAQNILRNQGIMTKFIHVKWLAPFPTELLVSETRNKNVIVIENNRTGLLNSLLREHLLIDADHKILKYDGRPFYPEEIAEEVKEVANL